jgi:hypothetical protein
MRRTVIAVCALAVVPMLPLSALAGEEWPALKTALSWAVEVHDPAPPPLTLESSRGDREDRDDWDDDAWDDDDDDCRRCKHRKRHRGGGGGGVTLGYLRANFEVLNEKVSEMGIHPLSEDIFLIGGRGYGRIRCFIIGGGGYGGWTETSGIPDCCSRQVKLEMGYGGLILGVNKGTDWVEGTLGALIGGGGIQVVRKRNSTSVAGWDGAWLPFEKTAEDSVATDDLNITSVLSAAFFALEPYFELRAWVLPWLSLDFSGSYLWARVSRGQWKVDDVKIPDSPQTNIGGASFKFTLNFGA